MTDLSAMLPFEEALPPGLAFACDLIDEREEQALIAAIERLDLPHFVFQRWTSRRRTRSFGYSYDFRDASFAAAEPIPGFLLPLRAQAAVFAGVTSDSLLQASVIRYEPGAGIGWHRDRPELGTVVGISLGAATTMRFRRKTPEATRRAAKFLPPRSVYHLAGPVRDEWEHSIPPGSALRWSVTFRGLTEIGQARVGRSCQATVVVPART